MGLGLSLIWQSKKKRPNHILKGIIFNLIKTCQRITSHTSHPPPGHSVMRRRDTLLLWRELLLEEEEVEEAEEVEEEEEVEEVLVTLNRDRRWVTKASHRWAGGREQLPSHT
jgi:hypothetical protein